MPKKVQFKRRGAHDPYQEVFAMALCLPRYDQDGNRLSLAEQDLWNMSPQERKALRERYINTPERRRSYRELLRS